MTELEKQARERDNRESKLKQLVLKAKKEAAEYKSKVRIQGPGGGTEARLGYGAM